MKVWKTIGIIFILIIVLLGALILNVNSQENNYIQSVNKQNALIEEFDKQYNTFKEDTNEMNHIMDKYNLKSISIDERIQILNEYITFYSLVDRSKDFLQIYSLNFPHEKTTQI